MTHVKFLVEQRMALALPSETFINVICDSQRDIYFVNSFREECSNKGGTSSSSCASGFGVCCISMLLGYNMLGYLGGCNDCFSYHWL